MDLGVEDRALYRRDPQAEGTQATGSPAHHPPDVTTEGKGPERATVCRPYTV